MINKITIVLLIVVIFKSFVRGDFHNGGLSVPKSKREEGQDRGKPDVPRTNLTWLG